MTVDDPLRAPDPLASPPEPAADRRDDPDAPAQAEPTIRVRQRGNSLGLVACILAAMLFVVNVVGIVLSNTGSDAMALSLAYITIFGTIMTFVGGLLAAALDFGRVWGTAAVVLSVFANPFVLVVVLGSFTGAVR